MRSDSPPLSRRRLLGACASSLAVGVGVRRARAESARAGRSYETDLCVYGGTAAGLAAAIQMRRFGKKVLVLSPERHLGGMTTSGLGSTDIGNRSAIGGFAREFYRNIRDHYLRTYGPDSPQLRDCHDGFRFEPHVAEETFLRFVAETNVPVLPGQRLKAVRKTGNRITEVETEDGSIVRARIFIDATYEGDLMAMARVSYTVGREPNAKYNETLNGVQFGRPFHQFKVPIDPYVTPGVPASGLLKGVTAANNARTGEGDDRIQAYNFRMCLTTVPENRVPFPKPKSYDPERYTLLARYLQAGVWDALRLSSLLPNGKTDTNNHGAFSTDNIGMNYDYPEGSPAVRRRIYRDHLTYQQGLMWFLSHDERVPKDVRDELAPWGLARDEFRDNENWPYEMYIREARRMVSAYVMTEQNCRGAARITDSIGLAAYTMDSHHVQRTVRNGSVVNEGDVQVGGFPPYPISYRALVPHEMQCANLLVPVCLAASHIAYGSIRMEPVFMVLGQSAATAAYFALEENIAVQQVDVARLQVRLLEDGHVLEWTEKVADTRVAPAADTKVLKGIVMDDREAKKVGEWVVSNRAEERRVGTGYIHDGNSNKGELSVSYSPDIPEDGSYAIVLIFPPNPNRASNVPVTIKVEGVGSTMLRINQREESADGFMSLGVYKLPKGKRTTVTLSNRGTDGYVVADGIQFVRGQ